MKTLGIMLALAGMLMGSVLAQSAQGGIAGVVTDARTGQPLAHVKVYYYRVPYLEHGQNRIMTLETDRHGFFSDITLDPGRYVVTALVQGRVLGCAVDDVMTGETARMKIVIGQRHIMCSGPRVHPTVVDPNATADVYRI